MRTSHHTFVAAVLPTPDEQPIEHRQIAADWLSVGQDLANQGSANYDRCIELVCRNCERPFRAATLESWGIANAAMQIEAWAFYSNLSEDNPLRRLSNSQRLSLFSQGANWSDRLAESAREHLLSGGSPSRVTDSWAEVMVKGYKMEASSLRADANVRSGYKTMSERLSIIEAERQQLAAENQKLRALVEVMSQQLQAVGVAA